MKIEDVIIIGAGPSGIAAAIQLRRYGVNAVVLEKDMIGGLLRNANLVENYPGFPRGISGPELIGLFKTQLDKWYIDITHDTVTNLDFADDLFDVTCAQSLYKARVVMVATGTKPKEITDLPVHDNVKNRILYEVYHLLDKKDLRIAIVGAGDAAFDYAINLANANQVTILNRGEEVRCLPLLYDRAMAMDKIRYVANVRIEKIDGAAVNGLTIDCYHLNKSLRLSVDYLVFAIGREPQLNFLSREFKAMMKNLEDRGLLYFAGDIKNAIYRQTAIAVGDGIMAAMKIYEKLKEIKS
jgi:thioredoxin reductase (NADPH)